MRKFFIQYSNRINKLSILLLSFSLILIVYFFKIQIISHEKAKSIVYKKGWKTKITYGDRGEILDANGKKLAITIQKYDFWVNTNNEFDLETISKIFSETFNRTQEYYKEKLEKKSNYVKLAKQVLFLDCQNILAEINNLKGLRYEKNNKRFYPNNNLACQTIGYVDTGGKGIGGIEGNFNAILTGDTTTSKLRKGIKGRYYKQTNQSLGTEANGYDIYLTIDLENQRILQNELSKIAMHTNAESANGIIIDPNNGNILAMASFPSYNPNNYFDYNIESFKNRTISDAYEPGSTFKSISLSAALDLEKTKLDDIYYCEMGQTKLKNNKLLRDHEEHGDLSTLDIFAYSSNIGTSKIAEKLNNIELYKYCKNFGFGSKTNLPFNNESSGKIRPINNWSKTSKNYISIGQELSITNIQLASAYSAIANGGYLLKPNIIKEIKSNNKTIYKNKIEPIRKVISEDTASDLIRAMEKVVTYGTAENINLDGYKIAGKTGTAQKYIENKYSPTNFVATFASIFPSNSPKYVIIISVDSPSYGYHWANESAVPISREIIKKMIINDSRISKSIPTILASNQEIRKQIKYSSIKYNKGYKSNNITPNLRGKTLREALLIANSLGLEIETNSLVGKVVWQSMKPGEKIEKNQICRIKLNI